MFFVMARDDTEERSLKKLCSSTTIYVFQCNEAIQQAFKVIICFTLFSPLCHSCLFHSSAATPSEYKNIMNLYIIQSLEDLLIFPAKVK